MSKLKIKLVGDRILVQHVEDTEQIRGGVIIPDSAKEKPQEDRGSPQTRNSARPVPTARPPFLCIIANIQSLRASRRPMVRSTSLSKVAVKPM
ncbi:MAG TPA: hypothetical protein VFB27_14640 [Opitutaceae bacterium]|nr:hypothetical protein [Opitutaceae bacterium]